MSTKEYNGDIKVENLEALHKTETTESDRQHVQEIQALSPEEQKKLIRRIDLRLVVTLGFMYCVSLMDRTNLGIAVVAGMGVDLRLDIGERYSIIVLIFFITYVLLQPPATVVLRKVGPRIFLPTITLLWGITMITFGFVKDWYDMVPLRLVLGVFEAGFFPGMSQMDTYQPFIAALTKLIQDVHICSAAGIPAMSSRSEMQSSTSLARWHLLSPVSSRTASPSSRTTVTGPSGGVSTTIQQKPTRISCPEFFPVLLDGDGSLFCKAF